MQELQLQGEWEKSWPLMLSRGRIPRLTMACPSSALARLLGRRSAAQFDRRGKARTKSASDDSMQTSDSEPSASASSCGLLPTDSFAFVRGTALLHLH